MTDNENERLCELLAKTSLTLDEASELDTLAVEFAREAYESLSYESLSAEVATDRAISADFGPESAPEAASGGSARPLLMGPGSEKRVQTGA